MCIRDSITRRRENFLAYDKCFSEITGATPIFSSLPPSAVPYVFPLWVNDPDPLYKYLLSQRLPVFRRDRIRYGTTNTVGDVDHLRSYHVLQLLCHQDISDSDIQKIALTITRILADQTKKTCTPKEA